MRTFNNFNGDCEGPGDFTGDGGVLVGGFKGDGYSGDADEIRGGNGDGGGPDAAMDMHWFVDVPAGDGPP